MRVIKIILAVILFWTALSFLIVGIFAFTTPEMGLVAGFISIAIGALCAWGGIKLVKRQGANTAVEKQPAGQREASAKSFEITVETAEEQSLKSLEQKIGDALKSAPVITPSVNIDNENTRVTEDYSAIPSQQAFPGELNRLKAAGLSMYEWSTCGDEFARPSHALMNGKLCKISDSTVYSSDGGKTWKPRPDGSVLLHPGEDGNCQCTALAYHQELVGKI